ncbi:MAG: HEAT repeat domain-containing protein, partial [Myxococcota bacterium]
MHDLDLWHGLADRSLSPKQATEGLEALADLSPAKRAVFWPVLGPSLASSNPGLRAAALRALAGARGYRGIIEFVRLLDDPEARVREAAVHSLRESADGPGRWSHVLFHANASIRRLGLDATPISVPAGMPLALLADPATADRVHRKLPELVTSGAVIPFVIELVETDILSAQQARELLLADWVRDEPNRFFDPLPVNFGFPSARTELSEYRAVRDAFIGEDQLDRVLLLFWDSDDAFFARLGETMKAERLTEDQERRLAWALARVGGRKPEGWTGPRLALLAAVMPIVLADP